MGQIFHACAYDTGMAFYIGVTQKNLLLKNNNSSLFEAVELDLSGERENSSNIKVETDVDETIFKFCNRDKEFSFTL